MSDVCIGSSVNDTPAHESSRVTSNNPTAVDKTNPRAMFESAFEVWHNVGWKDLNENKTLRDLEQKVEGWLTQMNLPVPRNTLCAWFKEMAAIYPVGFGEWFEKTCSGTSDELTGCLNNSAIHQYVGPALIPETSCFAAKDCSTVVSSPTAITKVHSPTKTSPNAVRLGAQEGTTPASTSDPAPTISNLPPAALQRDAKSSNGKPPRKSSSGEERMPGGKALKAARAPTEKKLYYVRHPPQSMPGSGTSSCARNLSHQKPEKQGVPCHPNTDNRSNLSNSFDNELLAKSASNNQNRLLSDQTFMTQPLNKLYFMPLDIRGQISNANQYQNMIPATSSDIMSSAGGHPIVTELSPIQTTANNSRNPCLMHHIPQPQSKATRSEYVDTISQEKQKPCYDSSNNDMNNISTSQNNRQISEAPKLFSSTGKMRKRDPAKARQIAVAAIKMYSSMQKQAAQYRRRMELSNPFTISPNYPGQCDRYRYFQPYQLPVGVGYSGGGSSVRVDESPQYKAVQKMFDIIIGECVTGLERAIGYDGVDREILIGPDSVRKSSTDTASASDEWDRWRIDPEHELRFEVGIKESIVLKITSGAAEIFGTELAPDIEYTFSAQKIACFSWRGCEAMTKGKCGVAYTAGETPMHQYLNVHLALEAVRKDAASFSTSSNLLFGPKVMIVGPSDVGKSTLAKILVNYSIKLGHLQMYADIDIGEASLSLPGCLTANVFSRAVDIEEGMGGAMSRSGAAPMCFYYGYGDISDKPKLYQKMMERLSEVIDEKLKKDASVRTAGIVFDTPAQFSEPIGYELMNQAISLFKPTVILVLGHERLYADLSRRLKDGKEITVLKLAKSGGVVTRDKAFRRAIQSMKIREYFYGTPKFPLNPASNTVGFHELTVRRVGDTTLAPSSALPLGQERKVQETKIVKMEVGDTLLNSILAVSHADRLDASAAAAATVSAPALTADEETALILEKNVAGFVYVSEVDDVKKKLTVLAPNPGRLPKKYMVMGSLKWVEMN
ncbi:hypothetical protein HDU82_005999 [Entophlyctis luteolus]|nr:hypothetical protein HDU82_005999 [Entophlyctis luteolus]